MQWFNDVWSYDPRQNVWSQLDCIGYIPAPREGHSAALVGDVMYIFGGRTEEGTDLGDLAAFRITSRRWYTFQNMGPSPSPRSGHSMTAYGKQIVVLAGEPSLTSSDPNELSLVYILDTVKIRYPNDQQIQQTPSGERVLGSRRPSGERGPTPTGRGPAARDTSTGPSEGSRRMASGSRESMLGAPGPAVRGQDPGLINGPTGGRTQDPNMMNGPAINGPPPGPGSRLPRASVTQAPSGPPPQQQLPPPRPNGVPPVMNGPRSRTPTRDGRGFGPPVDTARATSFDETPPPAVLRSTSPMGGDSARQGPTNQSFGPASNERRGPMQQYSGSPEGFINRDEPTQANGTSLRSRSRQDRQQPSIDSIDNVQASDQFQQRPYQGQVERSVTPQQRYMPTHYDSTDDRSGQRKPKERSLSPSLVRQQEELRQQNENLSKEAEAAKELRQQNENLTNEVEAARSRNAWYASELALARKAGYKSHSTQSPTLDEGTAQSFGETEQPLIEALVAMRAELAQVQGSVDSRMASAAQQVAEVENERDIAVREAVYAKAKLAAHGGSHAGTPHSNDMSKELGGDDGRSGDIGRKLAAALASQHELQSKVDALTAETQTERRARGLAENTARAAQTSLAQLEQSRTPGEVEELRAQLHEVEKLARAEAIEKAEALTQAHLLETDNEDLRRRLDDADENSRNHVTVLGSLKEAVTSSSDKYTALERKFDEERRQREALDSKLLQLRGEHEERTAELETTTRKLRDAEDLIEKHATEARTHQGVVLAGLDKLNTRNLEDHAKAMTDHRVTILKQQLENANALVRKSQEDAERAVDKLRTAEERIASLEAFQEQSSRESLSIRKQLQDALRETQMLQTQHDGVRQQLETQQRDTGALQIQHKALKELLEERDREKDREIQSPAPDHARIEELESQLESSVKAHEETRSIFENQEQEAERAYREKIEQLEQDYQSAVHYVKGTEKMLKRMKDELQKYKTQNSRLQNELEVAHRSQSERSMDSDVPLDWETERQSLRREIEEMQESVKGSVSQLERQMQEVQSELRAAQNERDHYRVSNEQAQQHLSHATRQARNDLEHLKSENAMLENRAIDAEQKVTLLLDQVGTSVGNYRRQSQTMANGSHTRNQSTTSNLTAGGGHSQSNSISADSTFSVGPDNRTSLALDSLASELETLRTHWEGTHRNYRLSNQFDFERTPTIGGSGGDGMLNESLASWRKRLDAEEAEKENSPSPVGNGRGSPAASGFTKNGPGRQASPRIGDPERMRKGLTSPLGREGEGEPRII